MIADLNNLVRLNKAQVKPAAEVLSRAFQNYPLLQYYFHDELERKKIALYFVSFAIFSGIRYGEIYATSPNLEGVAVWLPSEKANMTLWRVIRSGGLSLLFKLGIKFISRQRSITDYILSIHKRHAPFRHWFLQSIGVDPMFQGKGYASTLLKTMFVRLDQEHLPCYLDTQNEKNVSIYQHYGFKVVEEVTITGTEISHWAMLREKSS